MGGQWAIGGPGGGIKLTNYLGPAISAGNRLAINTNSLLRLGLWPINLSEAATGNSDERGLRSPFGVIGQEGAHPASARISPKWQLQWPASYLIRAPSRPIRAAREMREGEGETENCQ